MAFRRLDCVFTLLFASQRFVLPATSVRSHSYKAVGHWVSAKYPEHQAQVEALKRLQAEIAAELDALLPANLDRALKGELQYACR